MDPKDIVRRGYDALSYRYRGDSEEPAQYATWLAQLRERVPAGGAILDLGCGCGVPLARDLAASGYEVIGVDLSAVPVERARHLVPTARFLHADATQVSFPPSAFDAVVSLYALIHLPLDEQPALLGRIGRWLRPKGWYRATTGYRTWIEQAGLTVVARSTWVGRSFRAPGPRSIRPPNRTRGSLDADPCRPAARDQSWWPEPGRHGGVAGGRGGPGPPRGGHLDPERERGLSGGEADQAEMAAELERAIADRLGVRSRVVVLSRDELAKVVADNPFPDEPDPRSVHAVFRTGPLTPEELAAVAAAEERGSGDEARVVGTTLYLHTPDGFGRSELAAQLTRVGGAEAAATARNWATVRKLLAICDG